MFGCDSEFKRGLKDSVPVCLGIVPFAVILGAQASQKGMSSLEIVLMMGLNFAGGSEFAAVGLWGSPLPVLLIWGSTLMINSRHVLMGVALSPYVRDLPLKKLLPTLFVMTDESWALSISDVKKRERVGLNLFSLPYYWGTAAMLYPLWVVCGALGWLAAPVLGDVDKLGFGMAFPAVFLVLLRGMWRGWQAALPWLVSILAAAAVYLLWPANGWYVAAGTVSGLVVAYLTMGDDV